MNIEYIKIEFKLQKLIAYQNAIKTHYFYGITKTPLFRMIYGRLKRASLCINTSRVSVCSLLLLLLSVVRCFFLFFLALDVLNSLSLVGCLNWFGSVWIFFLSIVYVCESKYTMTDVTTVDVTLYRVLNFQMYLAHNTAYSEYMPLALAKGFWMGKIP